MYRLFLLFLLLITGATAQIHTLGPARDLNDSINLGEFVSLNYFRTKDIVGIDLAKGRLVHVRYFSTVNSNESSVISVIKEGVSPGAYVLKNQYGYSGGREVVLLDGDDAFTWSIPSELTPTAWPTPRHFKIPSFLPKGYIDDRVNSFNAPMIRDFDQDGLADLYIPRQYEYYWLDSKASPAGIIFSFGREDSQWVPIFPETSITIIEVGPSWTQGGPPTLSINTISNYAESAKFRLYRFTRSRTLESISGTDQMPTGRLMKTNSDLPPKIFQINQKDTSAGTFTASVYECVNEEWRLSSSIEFRTKIRNQDYLYPYIIPNENGELIDGEITILLNGSGVMNANGNMVELLRMPRDGSAVVSLGLIEGRAKNATKHNSPYVGSTLISVMMYASNIFSYIPDSAYGISTLFFTYNSNNVYREDYCIGKFAVESEVGDLNGDGAPDLVALRRDSSVASLLGSIHASSSQLTQNKDVEGYHINSILLNDENKDGMDDLLAFDYHGLNTYLATGAVEGVPTFSFLADSSGFGDKNQALGYGDFDGDGDEDVLFVTPYYKLLGWVENLGGGKYGAAHYISLAGRTSDLMTGDKLIGKNQVLIGDFDGDGDIDIITAPSALGDRVALYRNQGTYFNLEPISPTFDQLPGNLNIYMPGISMASIKAGNFYANQPGYQFALKWITTDQLAGYTSSAVWIMTMTPSGVVISPQPITFGSGFCGEIAVADFDGDGLDDLIAVINGEDPVYMRTTPQTPSIKYRRNLGNGTFGPIITLGKASGYATQVDARDYDGDGLCDILVTSAYTGTVELFTHQVAPSPNNDYATWCQANGLSPDDIHGDSDHDGISNIFEYAAGTSPSVPDSGSTGSFTIGPISNLINLTHSRPYLGSATSVQIDAEYSLDLTQWFPAPNPPEVTVSQEAPDRENLRWIINPYDTTNPTAWEKRSQMFFRFKAHVPAGQ